MRHATTDVEWRDRFAPLIMTSDPVKIPHQVRFGEDFELDLRAYDLRRDGRVLKLERIPMELLILLIEERGQLVLRDQIIERIWGKDVFLDTDNSINAAIRKIRQVLKDNPEQPRFVQTVTGRGYRFIAPVVEVHPPGPAGIEVNPVHGIVSPPAEAIKVATPHTRSPWKILTPLLVLAVVGIASGGFYYRSVRANRLTDKDTIVLSDFSNTTGDPVFDDTLRQGLSLQLEQSPFLELISDRRVNETLKLMGRVGDRLTTEVTREVCLRIGSKAMLTGSIASLGSQYVIGLKAVNCETGDLLARAQERAANKEAVLKALDGAAVRVRSKLGESLSSVQKYATPLREATTPSLEALKIYSLGMKTFSTKGATGALPFLKRAVELDPAFAEAYASISAAYANLNEVGRAAENARKAYELREKVSELERFAIETNYHEVATGDLEKATQVLELWHQTYPRDARPVRDLGFMFASLGNQEQALEHAREALLMGPKSDLYYFALGVDYLDLNRLDEAEAVFKEAEQRKLESEFLLASRYQLAFVKGDRTQMTRMAATAMGKPGAEDLLLAAQAETEAWYGNLKNARELTQGAMESAEHNDSKETAGTYQAEAALREVESGNPERARADVDVAMKFPTNRDVRSISALVLARTGDTARAEKLATELEGTFPQDTLVLRFWLPSIRAAVALQRKDPKRAIELLKVNNAIELGAPATLQVALCPVYLRGEAYLMLHDGNRGAGEFQKFIDHRGLVGNFQWGALARLGLARAYTMQGDTVKARIAYQDFLSLWKGADPDIPILKQAEAEYAKLN